MHKNGWRWCGNGWKGKWPRDCIFSLNFEIQTFISRKFYLSSENFLNLEIQTFIFGKFLNLEIQTFISGKFFISGFNLNASCKTSPHEKFYEDKSLNLEI